MFGKFKYRLLFIQFPNPAFNLRMLTVKWFQVDIAAGITRPFTYWEEKILKSVNSTGNI